jgi:hypothetical protein
MIAFCAATGFNLWVHAPKDDPWHRARWREPYPDAELARLGELSSAATRHGVAFAYAIAPGLDVCCSGDADFRALRDKLTQLRSVGVDHFQLLWDDVEPSLHCEEDARRFGSAASPVGAAQAHFSSRVADEVAQPGPLLVCPTDYAGAEEGPYRRSLRAGLGAGTVLYWTGPDVVCETIDRRDLDRSVACYGGHAHVLWDNYPVNDFAPAHLYLGPLRGRDPALAAGALEGLVANAMIQAVPSKLALATVARWAADPAGYEPVAALELALRDYGAEVLEALRSLAERPAGSLSAPAEVASIAGEQQRSPALGAAARPRDVAELAAALAPGVDAATGARLLEGFV